jgi:ATP/maltotriose-dependent transcriptional regulator MalT
VTVTETLPGTTVKQTATVTQPENPPPPPPSTEPAGSVSLSEARQLTDQATAALRSGDWEGAYALAERALSGLRGTGDIYEAYAYYDAGRALAELGECPKALDYIDRSESIQGSRPQFAEVRAKCS